MDALISSFTKKVINDLNVEQLIDLSILLEVDDENLYKFKQGIKTEPQIKENRISKMFKDYIYKK